MLHSVKIIISNDRFTNVVVGGSRIQPVRKEEDDQ